QRGGRKAGDAFDREVPELPEVELRAARRACDTVIRNGDLPESHPAEQTLHEAVAFAQLSQGRERTGREQAEVAGVGGNGSARQFADHAVERRRRGALEPALA